MLLVLLLLFVLVIIFIILLPSVSFITRDFLKKYAALCKEAGMSVSPPGQSCCVLEWHETAESEQRFPEAKRCSLYHRLTEEKSCDPC